MEIQIKLTIDARHLVLAEKESTDKPSERVNFLQRFIDKFGIAFLNFKMDSKCDADDVYIVWTRQGIELVLNTITQRYEVYELKYKAIAA